MIRFAVPNAGTCRVPLFMASTVSLLNVGLAFRFFPETLDAATRQKRAESDKGRHRASAPVTNSNDFGAGVQAGSKSRVRGAIRESVCGPVKYLLKSRKTTMYAIMIGVYSLASISSFALPWWTDLRFHWSELDFSLFTLCCRIWARQLWTYPSPCFEAGIYKKGDFHINPFPVYQSDFLWFVVKPWMWYATMFSSSLLW